MADEILSVKELAAFLKIKEQTAYRLVQQGKLPALKIGGQWKIKKSHLDRMFDEMLQKTVDNIQEQYEDID